VKIENILSAKGGTVHTISPEKTLQDAVQMLAAKNVGALVAVDSAGKPVGILSERDIVRAAARGGNALALRVAEVMTKEVITASPQDDAQAVGQTMTDHHFRHMPIVEQGKMVGIVSIGDLLKAQLEEYQGLLENYQMEKS